jgi:hypothetical protein
MVLTTGKKQVLSVIEKEFWRNEDLCSLLKMIGQQGFVVLCLLESPCVIRITGDVFGPLPTSAVHSYSGIF